MALINCPECNKEISDKAKSCPNCGLPLRELEVEHDRNEHEELLKIPELPIDLNIGNQIVNWGFDAAVDGFFDFRENVVTSIESGKVQEAEHDLGKLGLVLDTLTIQNVQL